MPTEQDRAVAADILAEHGFQELADEVRWRRIDIAPGQIYEVASESSRYTAHIMQSDATSNRFTQPVSAQVQLVIGLFPKP